MAKASRGSSIEKYNSIFATRLRDLIENTPNATQVQLAEVIGVSRQTVSQYANGISEPGYDALIKIANHFNVSLDYLLGRSEAKTTDICIQAICEKTGLSENSIYLLRNFAKPTDDTFHYYYDHYNDCSSYAFELVNEFIDFALDSRKGFGFPFDNYLTFRQQNNIHRENVEKWGQATPKEREHISATMLITHSEALERGSYPLTPADASDFFRKGFCDDFKDYLKSKYPLVDYPTPPGFTKLMGEDN